MNKTKIDWCDSTWNPVTGCLHGCEYCYAKNISHRFGGEYEQFYKWGNKELDKPLQDIKNGKVVNLPYPYGFLPTFHRYHLNDYATKKGRNIFVCSMADLMGEWISEEWKHEIINACDNAPQHNYLFLTKNPLGYSIWHDSVYSFENRDNFWLGVTFSGRKEDIPKEYESGVRDIREDYLYKMSGNLNHAKHKFISIEPIMCDVANLHSEYIDGHTGNPFNDYWFRKEQISYFQWVIVGAETGRRKYKVIPKKEWIENLVELCKEKKIPLFMKSSLADIWGEPLIQEYPEKLKK